MTTAARRETLEDGGHRGDSFAEGVLLLVVLAVVQRAIGFGRSLLFCSWLPPEELGRWDLAFGFLMLAGPLAVLGLPGCLGRYVAHYREHGALRAFLGRVVLVSGGVAVLTAVGLAIGREWVAVALFGDAAYANLVVWVVAALLLVVAFNFILELVMALCWPRAATWMQFANGLAFAACGAVLVLGTTWGAAGVVAAYGAACFLTTAGAALLLRRRWKREPRDRSSLAGRRLWSRIMPFAIWLWLADVVMNLFASVDRYMIVHLSGLEAAEASLLVADYHASRIVPFLMVALADMLSGMLLPYLSRDWEAGRRAAVSEQTNLALKLGGLAITLGSAVVLLASPLLFDVLLAGKYDGGRDVLPWTLVACCYLALVSVANAFLLCAERGKLITGSLAAGLAINVVLNAFLLPRFGLVGAVAATAAANAVVVLLVYFLCGRVGLARDRAAWLVAALPLGLKRGWLFTPPQRDTLSAALDRYAGIWRTRFAQRRATSSRA